MTSTQKADGVIPIFYLDEEYAAANEAADWLIDAVATALQDRRFLRGGREYDPIVGNAIIMCGIVACLRAISGSKHVE
jgi:hypothetical protein